MNRIEAGRQQIENAILDFPGMVGEEIDLSVFLHEETKHRVREAKYFQKKLLETLTHGGEKGIQMPWTGFHGKFEFRPSELTVWSGYKGHGKSIAISQVFESFLTEGKKCFIISPEFPAHRVLYRMMCQSLGINRATSNNAIDWLDAVNGYLWLYDLQSSLHPGDVPALCRYAVDRLGVEHILIDSLMKCGIGPDDYSAQKNLVDRIQQVAHKTESHIHLVAHARKGSSDSHIGGLHDIKGTSEIVDLAENVIVVWRNKQKEMEKDSKQGEPDAILKVEAQRNADGWIGSVPLLFNRGNATFSEML